MSKERPPMMSDQPKGENPDKSKEDWPFDPMEPVGPNDPVVPGN